MPYRGSTWANTISLRDALAIEITAIDEREEDEGADERPRHSHSTIVSERPPSTSPFKDPSLNGRLSTSTADKHEIEHVEERPASGAVTSEWAEIKADADRSEAHEHSLTVLQSLKIYKAVGPVGDLQLGAR